MPPLHFNAEARLVPSIGFEGYPAQELFTFYFQ